MRSISNIAAAAAIVSIAAAGNAPIATAGSVGNTYSATIPAKVDTISGAIIGAPAPDGKGTSFQVSFYNLPSTGNLSYMLHVDKISNGDCSTAGAVLDPYAGTTGAKCATDMASCQVGDLSDKHGEAMVLSGGSGTGYFPANYVDEYVSTDPSNQAFFGKGSIVITDVNGAAVACASFIDGSKVRGNATTNTASSSSSSMATHKSTGTGGTNGGQNNQQSSSSTSSGFAVRTAAPVFGAGILGLAAMLL